MKFNLSHLRKLSVDKDFTTLQHPSGHEIKIAHRHLQPKMRGELEAIPMASGGDPADESSIRDNMNAEIDQEIANADSAAQQAEPMPQVQAAPMPVPEKTYEVPQANPLTLQRSTNKVDPNDPTGIVGAVNQQKTGLEQEANAQSQQARESIPVLQKQADEEKQLVDTYQSHVKELNGKRQTLLEDYQKQHVNPDHYWEDKSLGGKVSSVIGLILGGIGGGLTGQENPALKLLNMNIDRDMHAQRLNMDNKMSLLNLNRQDLQNEHDALSMTRVMKLDQVSQELKLAAARSADPLAKARALQAAGQLDMQAEPLINQMAVKRTQMSVMSNPNVEPEQKLQALLTMGSINPQQHAEAVKELADYRNVEKASADIFNYFGQAAKENTVARTGAGLLREPAAIGLMENALLPLVKDKEGRVNEFDFATVKKFEPRPGDSDSKVKEKLSGLHDWVRQKQSHPNLEGLGILQRTQSRFNPNGQAKTISSAQKGFK